MGLWVLERWNSLAEELTGTEYPTYTPEEAAAVYVLFMKFSDLWDKWQDKTDGTREKWKFKTRKHIPNINFMLNQIHHMLGLDFHNKRFPIPTTETSVRKLRLFFSNMLRELYQSGDLTLADIPNDMKPMLSVQKLLPMPIPLPKRKREEESSNAPCKKYIQLTISELYQWK